MRNDATITAPDYIEATCEDLLTGFDFDESYYDEVAKQTLSPDLYDALQSAKSIQRFERLNIPEKALSGETVYRHTLRLAHRVMQLNISEEMKSACLKMVYFHDLPEARALLAQGRTSDTTATEKFVDSTVDHSVRDLEDEAAQKMFTPEEYQIHQDYSNASGFLKGYFNLSMPTAEGLICKTLDTVDANIFYHIALVGNIGNLKDLTPAGTTLAFKTHRNFTARLDLLQDTEFAQISAFCQALLDECILTIKEMWDEVPANEIPVGIREEIEEL